MKSTLQIPVILGFALFALLIAPACSDGDSALNSDQGNVRVVLSADSGATTTGAMDAGSSAADAGAAAATDPAAGALDDDRDDDDGDDDGHGEDIMRRLEQANVTFASLLARNLDGQLIDLAVDLPRTVDLIGLSEGRSVTLPMGTLPPGMYDQMVVVMTQLELVFQNGAKVAVTPPGGGWTKIIPVRPFEVVEGETTTIELKFKPRQAFRELGGVFDFFPDFDCRTD